MILILLQLMKGRCCQHSLGRTAPGNSLCLVQGARPGGLSQLSVTLVDDSDQDAEAWERRYCQDIEP